MIKIVIIQVRNRHHCKVSQYNTYQVLSDKPGEWHHTTCDSLLNHRLIALMRFNMFPTRYIPKTSLFSWRKRKNSPATGAKALRKKIISCWWGAFLLWLRFHSNPPTPSNFPSPSGMLTETIMICWLDKSVVSKKKKQEFEILPFDLLQASTNTLFNFPALFISSSEIGHSVSSTSSLRGRYMN